MSSNYLKILLVSLLALVISQSSHAQLEINDSLTVETLVDDFFNSGVLVDINNVTFNGASADSINPQVGFFSNGVSDSLSMESGLLMMTGYVGTIIGNNISTLLNNYQDSDIASITNSNVNDCAVIEFDVIVNADALAFSYFFASTEYASFTCSAFNDGFGLFISGPGISGPYTNNAVNIATIPDSEIPVAINTINSGVSSSPGNDTNCESANPNWLEDSQYFIQNSSNEVSSITFNGWTENFEAFVEVENGGTYHIKFAICDAMDGALDSGVFLETGSFEGRFLNNLNNAGIKSVNIYPNPASDRFLLKNVCQDCTGNIQIQISDIQGRIVADLEESNIDLIEVDIQDLEKGVYLVSVSNNSELIGTKKLVIE